MQNVDKHPKSGVYRVRVTVPEHLHAILGKKSITASLGTKDANAAKKAAIPVMDRLYRLISEAQAIYDAEKAGQPAKLKLTVQEGVRIINEWRDAYLVDFAASLNNDANSPAEYLALGDTPKEEADFRANNLELFIGLFYGDMAVPVAIANRTLDRVLAKAGYTVPPVHALRVALVANLRHAITYIRKRRFEWSQGDWSNPPPVIGAIAGTTPVGPAPVPASSTVSPAPPDQTAIRLSKLFDEYIEYSKPKSDVEQKFAKRQLCDFMGNPDPFIHEITRAVATQFYDVIKWQPKSRTVADSKLSLVQLADAMRSGATHRKRVAGGTAAKKIQLLSAMFAYAVDARMLNTGNPFIRVVGPRDAKPQTKRRPMAPEHLTAIFSAPIFMGCESYKKWRKPGNVLVANHRFWIPLLGMLTGCRLEEIGQLLISDIKREDGVIFVDVTEEIDDDETLVSTKSVKTKTSIRRVPIHQIALDAGFENYWQWLADHGETQLFPELQDEKRTKEVSRWFNQRLRPSIGVTGGRRVFHSFRHAFKDRCRAANLHPELHHTLTGHSSGSVGDEYGDGFDVASLKEGIDAITFPGFPGVPPRIGKFFLTDGIGVEMHRQLTTQAL